jgi:hypothetical protein
MLMQRLAWILFAVALVGFILIYGVFNPEWQVPSTSPVVRVVVAIGTHLLVVVVPSVVLSLLFSPVFYRQLAYSHRVFLFFPWAMTIMLLSVDLAYSERILYSWRELGVIKLQTAKDLNDIPAPVGLDCMKVRTGNFHYGGVIVERNDTTQTHLWPSGETEFYKVAWRDGCAYDLLPFDSASAATSVMIIDVTERWYDCVLTSAQGCLLVRMHFGIPAAKMRSS